MATLDEIIDEQNTIHEELERMAADDSTTEEADGGIRDTLVKKWKDLASQDRGNAESGDGGGEQWGGGQSPQFMQRRDPLAGREESKDYAMLPRSDVIARASSLIEVHDRRGWLPGRGEVATRVAQAPSIARHMLMYGADEYYDAFRDYVADPTGPGLQRAAGALSLASAQGGYLLPYFLDPTIVITTDGTTNPYRRIANVQKVTTNAYQGVNSAGVQAAMVDEANAAGTGNYQGVGQIQIGIKKAFAWVYGSFEANEDTNFADQLPRLIQDGKDILEESKFAVGTGGTALNSGEPLGVVASLGTAQRVNAGATGAISATDVYNLEAALGPRFRLAGSIGWAANITAINKVRAASPSGAGSSFWATLGDGTPSRLLNHTIVESPSVTSAAGTGTASSGTASAQLVFGAWENYVIVDRIGMSMLFDPMLKGTGASANVPTGQQGWLAFWRYGGGVSTANAFRWLQYSTG